MWLIFTGFIAATYALQVPKGYTRDQLIIGLCYAYFTLYMFFCYVPTTIVTKPWNFVFDNISKFICGKFSLKIRQIGYACIVTIIIVATIFSFPEKEESPRIRRLISLFGLFVFLFFTWAFSAVSIIVKRDYIELQNTYLNFHSIVKRSNGTPSHLLSSFNSCWLCSFSDLQLVMISLIGWPNLLKVTFITLSMVLNSFSVTLLLVPVPLPLTFFPLLFSSPLLSKFYTILVVFNGS